MKRLLLPILVLICTTSVSAQEADKVATESRIAKQSTTETGDRGFFTIPSNENQFSFGYGWTNVNRSPRDLNISSFPVFLSYGLLGRLTLTGSFDIDRQLSAAAHGKYTVRATASDGKGSTATSVIELTIKP